jgi:hypothetical protein
MGLIITKQILKVCGEREKYLKQIKENSEKDKGEKITYAEELVSLDPKLIEKLLKEPLIELKECIKTCAMYVTGIGIVPMNIQEMMEKRSLGVNDYLHFELVEYSEHLSRRTLLESESKRFLYGRMERFSVGYNAMYEAMWGKYRGKCDNKIPPFKIFRSKLGLELKEKYVIKNL